MKVEILGTGCAKCTQLYNNALEAVRASGKDGEVVKVREIAKIMAYGVISTPALAIDGAVKFSGRVASAEEIKSML